MFQWNDRDSADITVNISNLKEYQWVVFYSSFAFSLSFSFRIISFY